jgi:hypothetical protein
MAKKAQQFEINSLEHFTEFVYEQGWTDGLPVFPPTPDAISRMVDYIGRARDEVLGSIYPGDGEATIENVAANCVMAGCLPEYLPVVLSAIESIVDPELPLTTTQSTGAGALCTIVTGPVVGKLKFHTREWIFGPNGGRANATIGRAIRLILWNIGRAHPGKLTKGTMGHPASWSYCIGEEQELSPWAPMHTDFGIAAGDSAVTVLKAGEHSQIAAPLNTVGLNECINILARGIGKPGVTSSGGKRAFLYVLNPSLAQAFADAGYSREKLREAIAGRAWKYSYDWQNDSKQGNAVPIADPYLKTPSERQIMAAPVQPDEVLIVVGGGVAPRMGQCVAVSSRSSAGKPFLIKPVKFPQ